MKITKSAVRSSRVPMHAPIVLGLFALSIFGASISVFYMVPPVITLCFVPSFLLCAVLMMRWPKVQELHGRYQAVERRELARLRVFCQVSVDINHALLSGDAEEKIYSMILDSALKLIGHARWGSVLTLDKENNFRIRASKGFDSSMVEKFTLPLNESLIYKHNFEEIRGRGKFKRDVIVHVRSEKGRSEWAYASSIIAPIFIRDQIFGVISCDSNDEKRFGVDDIRILERFRDLIEVCLRARADWNSSLEVSNIDQLTGFHSRRMFSVIAERFLTRACRHHERFVLAVCDVDDLKLCNDQFGHLAGDKVLSSIASELLSITRTADTWGRYGGDEFVGLFHVGGSDIVEEIFLRIRRRLADRGVIFEDQRVPASFSWGLASYPDDGETFEQLFANADKRLYLAKQAKAVPSHH